MAIGTMPEMDDHRPGQQAAISKARPAELLDWVAQRVAPYKKIRRLEVVDRIPKSSSGKILRRLLRETERAALSQTLPGGQK